MENIAQAFTSVLAMLLCLTFHEAAHAFIARIRGDRTAQMQGRLSLNPMAHADPLGTLILPTIGALFHMPILGWAKPVPVDPRNFKNPKWDHVLVSIAGPISNLLLCGLCVFLVMYYQIKLTDLIPEGSLFFPFIKLLGAMIYINAILAVFNLIPLPPLDGSAVLMAFLPRDMAEAYERTVAPYGFFILLILLATGGLNWIGKIAFIYVNVVQLLLQKLF